MFIVYNTHNNIDNKYPADLSIGPIYALAKYANTQHTPITLAIKYYTFLPISALIYQYCMSSSSCHHVVFLSSLTHEQPAQHIGFKFHHRNQPHRPTEYIVLYRAFYIFDFILFSRYGVQNTVSLTRHDSTLSTNSRGSRKDKKSSQASRYGIKYLIITSILIWYYNLQQLFEAHSFLVF